MLQVLALVQLHKARLLASCNSTILLTAATKSTVVCGSYIFSISFAANTCCPKNGLLAPINMTTHIYALRVPPTTLSFSLLMY